MATITIDIPVVGINAICDRFGYQTTINGSPNPQTKLQFAKQQGVQWYKSQIREHLVNTAAATAGNTAGSDVDANIPIT